MNNDERSYLAPPRSRGVREPRSGLGRGRSAARGPGTVANPRRPLLGPARPRQLASRRRQMRVLSVSGSPQRAMARQRAPPPGSAFLDKPFTLDALARKVRQMLDASIS